MPTFLKTLGDLLKEEGTKEALYDRHVSGKEKLEAEKKEEQKKLFESFVPEAVSVQPLQSASVQPLQSKQNFSEGPQTEQQRIIDSMRRNVEDPQIPEYDYNLSMPTRPASSNIQSERDISGRSTTGAGLQKKITPYDQEQAALRRMMQRGY